LPNIVSRKGAELFSFIKMMIEPQNIDDVLSYVIVNNHFTQMSVNDFTQSFDTKTGKEISPFINKWLHDTSTSAFLFGEIKISNIRTGDREKYFIRFPIVNNGTGEGIITVGIREQPKNKTVNGRIGLEGSITFQEDNKELPVTIEKTFNIPVGQTMEIGLLSDNEPRELVIDTYVAQNLPTSRKIRIDNINEEKISGFEGIRPYNGSVLTVKPYEFIIDNEDEGFSIINQQEKNTLKDWWMSRITTKTEDKYQFVNRWNPSPKWQFLLGDTYYGSYIKSGVYKQKGTGESKVQWEIELPESGNYSTYVYIPRVIRSDFMYRQGRSTNYQNGSFFYTVAHDDGEETVEIEIPQNEGWYFLGDFYISKGKTAISLSDKTDFGIVVGDAVKWVKK